MTTRTQRQPILSEWTDRHRLGLRASFDASWLPWLCGRVLTLLALVVAKELVHSGQVVDPKAIAGSTAGLLGSDAGWYQAIASGGYHHSGVAALRFFPFYPGAAHLIHEVTLLPVSVILVTLTSLFALASTMLAHRLAMFEFGDVRIARAITWLINLAPPAFVMVMGYAEGLFMALGLATFFYLRRRQWWWAAVFAFLAGMTRPTGIVLVLPALVEVLRPSFRVPDWKNGLARIIAVVAPAAGTAAYLIWVQAEFHDFLAPYRYQLQGSHHGLADPLVTVAHALTGALHGSHLGTALHLPWIAGTLVLLVVAFRRLPASYGLLAAAAMAVALSGSNLDSYERYAFAAFPLLFAAATFMRSTRVMTAVIAVCAAGMTGYTVLTFLGAYVP